MYKVTAGTRFLFPTDVRMGRGIVSNKPEALALGKHAYIVTGARSGRTSGALDDVIHSLETLRIEYTVFEGIENNPTVAQCRELGLAARSAGADFIIGIGGGSPMDAAKAVAIFALNDIDDDRLFVYGYDNGVLPIACVPTTSGTGSEVTPWSVMTRNDLKTKRGFGGRLTFPRVALIDPFYTESLTDEVSLSTAMDAFTHCFESYISTAATPFTDALNIYALSIFGDCVSALDDGRFDEVRDKLSEISVLGGMTISQTGTTMMHAMGYPLTYFKCALHGAANMYVLPAYVDELQKRRPERLESALNAMKMTLHELKDFTARHYTMDFAISNEEIQLYSQQTAMQASCKKTGIPCEIVDIVRMYMHMVGKK